MPTRFSIAVLFSLTILASSAFAFEGKYAASKGGYSHNAVIARAPDGGYKVKITVAARGCLGEFDGTGKTEGTILVARTSDKNDTCRISISKNGTGIVVHEDKCFMWHGARCDFGSILRKR